MQRSLERRRLVSSALACVAALATSCATNLLEPSRPFPYTQFTEEGPLEEVRPADVLVAPVHNQSGHAGVPLEGLRQALLQGLVDRLYSPLDTAYTEAQGSEAGAGAAAPQAILQVVVTRWDDTSFDEVGAVMVEGEARLLDASSPSRPLLWGVSLGRRVGSPTQVRGRVPAAEIADRLATEFAREVLALLPERDPLADQR